MSALNYLDVVEEYKELVKDLNGIIKKSGYKPSVLADKLQISRAEFYNKRKSSSFSVPEVEKLLNIIILETPDNSEDELIEELQEIEKKEVLYDTKTVKEMFNLR